MISRECKICLAQKPLECFPRGKKTKTGHVYSRTCKSCKNARARQRWAENPELHRQKQREKRAKRPEHYHQKTLEWRERNREYRLAYQRNYRLRHHQETLEWARKYKDGLADSYIKSLLVKKTNLNAHDIPKQLVELKRAELLIKRKLKKGANYENRK